MMKLHSKMAPTHAMVKLHKSELLLELLEDIDRGKLAPLTSVKNIEAVLAEFVDQYEDYAAMVDDLIEWHYIKQT